jgi:3D-(3,5/4)-trihydroxycyclohexane-1,2-dione acylhydrolase (decyclizing)
MPLMTMAQALLRYLAAQSTEVEGKTLPLFAGIFAIFGHGNVAGIGQALAELGDKLPTFRAHNEQAMALSAVAFAKASNRRRMMACTSSIGPGATNMVTAAAVAHVNRLPLLLLPGDVFAGRRPDPVLQQIENFTDPTVSANDCFRPVSRYWDRITRPEQLLSSLPQAIRVLTDPADCGPVVLALPQDVQAEAADFPESFFAPRVHRLRRPAPDAGELAEALRVLSSAKAPLLLCGGGVYYSEAGAELAAFAERHGIPVAETQAGKGALTWTHRLNVGSIGVTGTEAANGLAREADVLLAVGSRLQDFTTGSWALFKADGVRIVGLNVQPFDAYKHSALTLVADAKAGIEALDAKLGSWKSPAAWVSTAKAAKAAWLKAAKAVTDPTNSLPSDAHVIGAVHRARGSKATLVCASGGLPGELHKLWPSGAPGSYHLDYGYSTMGYEIAGGLGVKIARPQDDVVVMLGDGSYMMLNSEIATSVMLGRKLTIVVLDNRGFGCINRLQMATGGANFNNLFHDTLHEVMPEIDFAAHAASMGAVARKAASIAELERALKEAEKDERTSVIVIDTDPLISTDAGGHWWDVAVPEVSVRPSVRKARKDYEKKRKMQHLVN